MKMAGVLRYSNRVMGQRIALEAGLEQIAGRLGQAARVKMLVKQRATAFRVPTGTQNAVGLVEDLRELITAAARSMPAAKLSSVLSLRIGRLSKQIGPSAA